MALEEMDGVAAVYVDNGVKIHLSDETAFNENKVKAKLKEFKMTTKSVTKSESLPF